jgi:hypothetical protein
VGAQTGQARHRPEFRDDQKLGTGMGVNVVRRPQKSGKIT